jgi:hypothetical protein
MRRARLRLASQASVRNSQFVEGPVEFVVGQVAVRIEGRRVLVAVDLGPDPGLHRRDGSLEGLGEVGRPVVHDRLKLPRPTRTPSPISSWPVA